MALHLEGASVEDQLAERLDRLVTGRLDLWQLSPSLAGFYTLGYHHGRASLAAELQQARDESARWFELAHNPDAKTYNSMIQRRLDAAAEAAPSFESDADFFAHVLDAATRPRRAA